MVFLRIKTIRLKNKTNQIIILIGLRATDMALTNLLRPPCSGFSEKHAVFGLCLL